MFLSSYHANCFAHLIFSLPLSSLSLLNSGLNLLCEKNCPIISDMQFELLLGRVYFFCIHILVHVFLYWIPRATVLLFRLLICTPCRNSDAYIQRPEEEVLLIHNKTLLSVPVDVFGLMDVKQSEKEDRQFCCETERERRALKKEAKKKLLIYDSPFYNCHLATLLGYQRPACAIQYSCEMIHSWDGCPIALDWLYVKGVKPIQCHHSASPFMPSSKASWKTSTLSTKEGENNGITEPYEKPSPNFSSEENYFREKSVSQNSGIKVQGVVALIPGVTSDSQSGYIRRIVKELQKAGYHVCVVNTRGFGSDSKLHPFVINTAYTRDFKTIVERFFSKKAIINRFGVPLPIIGLGLSNGGATLSKYLGEVGRDGGEVHLDAGIACCAPNDFVSMVEHMNRGTMQKLVYQDVMSNDVRRYILSHPAFKRMPNIDVDYIFNRENVKRFSRVIHFDKHIFSKTSGYRSMYHYHLDASPALWLPFTPVPTLVLATFDDPVIGRTVMPYRWEEICENNHRLVYAETQWGGHLGFLGGPFDEVSGKPDYMARFVIQRMDAVCAYWRGIQAQRYPSEGLMPLHSEKWEKSDCSPKAYNFPSNIPTPKELPVNSVYFSNRMTEPVSKQLLRKPYFGPTTQPIKEALSKDAEESPALLEDTCTIIFDGEQARELNTKSIPLKEVLSNAHHFPVLSNCDYFVDPRLYMLDRPEKRVV